MIHKLSDTLISQIAAGEVIISPVEAIKELLENSLDAQAQRIEIFVTQGGLANIQVRDDGDGIEPQDLPLALASFATSKIDTVDDLFNIYTMGFRGEALSSIRSVSSIQIESRRRGAEGAWKISGEGETISEPQASPLPAGTRIVVDNLFFNVPIRKKFLKKENSLNKEISDLVVDYALAHPNIAFNLHIDSKSRLDLAPAKNLTQRIEHLFGYDFAEKLIPAYAEKDDTQLEGYISNFHSHHSRSNFIRLFINSRPVNYRPLLSILRSAYGELLPPGKFPAALLFLNLPPDLIDVNVHPQKKEVRFRDSSAIDAFLRSSLLKTIEGGGAIQARKLANLKGPKRRPWEHHPNDLAPPQTSDPENRQGETTGQGFTSTPPKNSAPPQEQNLDFQPPLVLREAFELYGRGSQSEEPLSGEKPRFIHTTLFDTIIVATSQDGLYLIDQHTAHERIQYERFLQKLATPKAAAATLEEDTGRAPSQSLVDPIPIQLTPGDRLLLESHAWELRQVGFALEDLGPAGAALGEIPAYLKAREAEGALHSALAFFDKNPEGDLPALFDHIAKSLACRSAVKKGESLPQASHAELIERLYQCKNPARCPHGRPTVVRLDQSEIFSLFKRGV